MKYDVIAAGELLIDMVSKEYVDHLGEAYSFEPHPGGSPANFASNLHFLGKRVGLISNVGNDAFGNTLKAFVEDRGLTSDLLTHSEEPSTVIFVAKTTGSPDFQVYRAADKNLRWSPFAKALAIGASVFHTTCFALSENPARVHILRAASAFAKTGATVSIDANYAEKVWPDRERAQLVLLDYIRHGAIVKMSEVDWERLYQEPLTKDNASASAKTLLAAGAKAVCFTFGADGAMAFDETTSVSITAKPIKIVDATGAGDSFWAGFVAAYLDRAELIDCLNAGANVAAKKLVQQGPLREMIDYRVG
ncbi:MAG: carbohydrate kinase family protein [Saprospiraceae bacterium]